MEFTHADAVTFGKIKDRSEKIAALIFKFMMAELSESEIDILNSWLDESAGNLQLFYDLHNGEKLFDDMREYQECKEQSKAVWPLILQRMEAIKVEKSSKKRMTRWLVAVAIVFTGALIALIVLLLKHHVNPK